MSSNPLKNFVPCNYIIPSPLTEVLMTTWTGNKTFSSLLMIASSDLILMTPDVDGRSISVLGWQWSDGFDGGCGILVIGCWIQEYRNWLTRCLFVMFSEFCDPRVLLGWRRRINESRSLLFGFEDPNRTNGEARVFWHFMSLWSGRTSY